MVRRSREAVGPVYMYLNINTSVHVKERHRLFVKSRGSSRYCWLYFKNTFIYSRTRGKVQLVCTQCVNTQTYEFSTNNGRRRRFRHQRNIFTIRRVKLAGKNKEKKLEVVLSLVDQSCKSIKVFMRRSPGKGATHCLMYDMLATDAKIKAGLGIAAPFRIST